MTSTNSVLLTPFLFNSRLVLLFLVLGFPVRGVNVARDYQGDDAVDTGFSDQVRS